MFTCTLNIYRSYCWDWNNNVGIDGVGSIGSSTETENRTLERGEEFLVLVEK